MNGNMKITVLQSIGVKFYTLTFNRWQHLTTNVMSKYALVFLGSYHAA